MARSPFSLSRLVRITPTGQVVYRAEKDEPQRFPDPGSPDLFAGAKRNFEVFQPLDFLAELVQHIPDKGEHLTRYYGYYSNKARGLRAKKAEKGGLAPEPDAVPRAGACTPFSEEGEQAPAPPPTPASPREAAEEPPPALSPSNGRRWAMLIKKIYHADPLRCPRCGGTMKVIAFIEAHQGDVIRRILQHCGLWQDPPPRAPPEPPRPPPGGKRGLASRRDACTLFRPATTGRPVPPETLAAAELDPDFLEHLRYQDAPDPEPPWDF